MVQLRNRRVGRKEASPPSPNQVTISSESNVSTDSSGSVDYNCFTITEILNSITARAKDPEIDKMVMALDTKISKGFKDFVEEEKRGRSLVISGLPEPPASVKQEDKLTDLDQKVGAILDVLKVECRPVEVYRMGRYDDQRPRLVKVVLPSRSHWVRALSNSRLLRTSTFSNVFVRRSMTAAERHLEYELRQEARERNNKLNARTWVVYRGELKNIHELPKQNKPGNA